MKTDTNNKMNESNNKQKKQPLVLIPSSVLRQIKASAGFNLFISIDLNHTDNLIDFDIEEVEKDGKEVIVCTSDNIKFQFDADIKLKKEFIYISEDGCLDKLILYDDYDRPYVLKPTSNYPDVMLNSNLMYENDPKKIISDELKLIKRCKSKPNEKGNSKNIFGNILLTDFKLGYLCKELAKISNSVKTFQEVDQLIELSKINPYTKSLFELDNIEFVADDLVEGIKGFEENSLSLIIQNNRIGDDDRLFSLSFFNECYRVMKPGAKMIIFHPGANSLKKLSEIGFKTLNKTEHIVCQK